MNATVFTMLILSAVILGCIVQEMASFDPKTATLQSCGEITAEAMRDVCYNAVAVRQNDVVICEKIGRDAQKDICFSGVAKGTGNVTICGRISDANIKSLCLQNFR